MTDAVVGEGLRVTQSGEPTVLLTKGDQYYEVLQKVGDTLVLNSPTSYQHASAAKMQADGYEAKTAIKIVKPEGTIMYITTLHGEQTGMYLAGKYYPVHKRKAHVWK